MTVQSDREAINEIWALFKETDAKFKETDDKLRRLEGLFGNQWGRLVEALVKPGVLRLFQERGIGVHYLSQRVLAQHNGSQMEVQRAASARGLGGVFFDGKQLIRNRSIHG